MAFALFSRMAAAFSALVRGLFELFLAWSTFGILEFSGTSSLSESARPVSCPDFSALTAGTIKNISVYKRPPVCDSYPKNRKCPHQRRLIPDFDQILHQMVELHHQPRQPDLEHSKQCIYDNIGKKMHLRTVLQKILSEMSHSLRLNDSS